MWWEILHQNGADYQSVGPTLQHNLISQTAMKGAKEELANENILHRALSSVSLTIQVTCRTNQGSESQFYSSCDAREEALGLSQRGVLCATLSL